MVFKSTKKGTRKNNKRERGERKVMMNVVWKQEAKLYSR